MTTPTIPFYPITHDDGLGIIDALNDIADTQNSPSLIAEEFDETKNYKIGDYAIYSACLYRFVASHPAGVWTGTDVVQITVEDELKELSESRDSIESSISAINSNLAGEFNAATAYKIGDIVMYNGTLYKFKAAHSAGAWIGTDAERVTVGDELFSLDIKAENQLTVNDDLDDIFTGGVYWIYSGNIPQNSPSGTNVNAFVVVFNSSGTSTGMSMQFYYAPAGGVVYEWRRRYFAGTWGAWTPVLLTQTLNNYVQTKTITDTTNANAAIPLGLDMNYEVIGVFGTTAGSIYRYVPITFGNNWWVFCAQPGPNMNNGIVGVQVTVTVIYRPVYL